MNTLRVDDKWSIEYDPQNNDRPTAWLRHNEPHRAFEESNAVLALFYALLQVDQEIG